jgi:predicted DNA binding protein
MSVIVEFSIAAENFVLGKALRRTAGLSVELEKMIPTGDAAIPYFWVRGKGKSEFTSVLEREEELSSFEVVDKLDGRWLYRAQWDLSVDTFVQAMVTHDAVLQEASGDAESWRFQLRFPDSHQLSEFHTDCRERDIDLTVESLYNPIEPATVEMRDLTTGQRSLIERVYDEGYFEVPRKVTLVEIAEELGISDQAVNERLRRGLSTLIEATLKSGSGPDE